MYVAFNEIFIQIVLLEFTDLLQNPKFAWLVIMVPPLLYNLFQSGESHFTIYNFMELRNSQLGGKKSVGPKITCPKWIFLVFILVSVAEEY